MLLNELNLLVVLRVDKQTAAHQDGICTGTQYLFGKRLKFVRFFGIRIDEHEISGSTRVYDVEEIVINQLSAYSRLYGFRHRFAL
ncbi:MAG: hypothetical protein MAGBODY4_00625 [Candidatus Marinimicrobia bacterium]|nr:hypothetical protein [Candidatus Neomarinimicrobiota bacterium]